MLGNLTSFTVTQQNDNAASFAAAQKDLIETDTHSSQKSDDGGLAMSVTSDNLSDFKQYLNQVVTQLARSDSDASDPETAQFTEQDAEVVIEKLVNYLADLERVDGDASGDPISDELAVAESTINKLIEALPPHKREQLIEIINAAYPAMTVSLVNEREVVELDDSSEASTDDNDQPSKPRSQDGQLSSQMTPTKTENVDAAKDTPIIDAVPRPVPIDDNAREVIEKLHGAASPQSTEIAKTQFVKNKKESEVTSVKGVDEPISVLNAANNDSEPELTDTTRKIVIDNTPRTQPNKIDRIDNGENMKLAPTKATEDEVGKEAEVESRDEPVVSANLPVNRTGPKSTEQIQKIGAHQSDTTTQSQDVEIEAIAQLKSELKAIILAMPPQEQQQFKQQLANTNSTDNKGMTPEQLLEQINISQQKVVGDVDPSVNLPRHNEGNQTLPNKQTVERTPVISVKDQNILGTKDEPDIAKIDGSADVKVKLTEQSSAVQVVANSFESMIKQLEGQQRTAVNSGGEQSHVAAANVRADQQHDVASQANAAPVKTVQEQLQQKLPLHQQFAAANLKERVGLMVNGGISQAVITLDPEELGAMSIRIVMQHDQLNVQFQVQNPAAKELLEQAMGKLKDMLGEQGIALGQSDVEQQSQQEQSQQQSANPSGEVTDEFVSDNDPVTLVLHKQSSDGIDYYA